jgi:formylglycine-generating enzyme required for sulfatase activity
MSVLTALALAGAASAPPPEPAYVAMPAGELRSVLARDTDREPTRLGAYWLREKPVTRGEFKRFLASHPEWRPEQVAPVFADAGYLKQGLEGGDADAPVTEVSWFAAQAYCESEGARLPTWYEWEYAAAADATRTDARSDPAWLARILGWYARPATQALPAVGGAANVYGVRDLHGLVWEWVDDFNALLINPDSRSGNDADKLKFCGAGAIDLQDRQNYAVLMRIALLSSLSAADSTGSLGFRCTREVKR